LGKKSCRRRGGWKKKKGRWASRVVQKRASKVILSGVVTRGKSRRGDLHEGFREGRGGRVWGRPRISIKCKGSKFRKLPRGGKEESGRDLWSKRAKIAGNGRRPFTAL